jgi:sterol desaturase/sphingolipid hydroxylase (fatty acid hydroxylase superfamily)
VRLAVFGFVLGILYANAIEWMIHKYLLHGLGKRKGSMWAFHWVGHHRSSRRNGMLDPEYRAPFWHWNARGKEIAGILVVVLVHTPLAIWSPYFALAVWYSGFNYLRMHRKAHLDPAWAKRHMRSHYDHHMGRNQDSNWCVTRPWFDWVMGTREYMEPSRRRSLVPALRVLTNGATVALCAAVAISPADLPHQASSVQLASGIAVAE